MLFAAVLQTGMKREKSKNPPICWVQIGKFFQIRKSIPDSKVTQPGDTTQYKAMLIGYYRPFQGHLLTLKNPQKVKLVKRTSKFHYPYWTEEVRSGESSM